MIPEQKTKLEREAESFAAFDTTAHTATGSYLVAKRGYIAAAKSILDNPREWGLKEASDTWFRMVDELTKYREALERIVDKYYSGVSEIGQPKWIAKDLVEIAKEALKQEGQ